MRGRCDCRRRTGTRPGGPTITVDPVVIATFRHAELVAVVRRHACGLPDEHLDPRDYGAR